MTFINIDTLTVKFIKKSTGSGIAIFFLMKNEVGVHPPKKVHRWQIAYNKMFNIISHQENANKLQ